MTVQPPSAMVACDRGNTAVEFGLILPALILLVVGIIGACIVVQSAASLQYAVEQAARCYSVNSAKCPDQATTQTYAQSQYHGLNKPQFTATTPACGYQVVAAVTVALNAGVSSWSIPLSATACFP